MDAPILALRWIASGHLIWLAAALFAARSQGIAPVLFGLFGLGVVCHLVAPIFLAAPHLGPFGVVLLWGTLTPTPLFWLLTSLIFDDTFRLRARHVLVASVSITVSAAVVILRQPAFGFPWPKLTLPILPFLPQLMSIAFVMAALYQIARGYRSDLVEWRIRLRLILSTGTATLMLGVALGEVFFRGPGAPPVLELLKLLLILALSWAFSAWLFSLRGERLALSGAPTRPGSAPMDMADPQNLRLTEALEGLIRERRIHRQEGLTIGRLAQEMGTQEYKLRRAINGGLRFRNFNQFLNHHRIADAKQMLTDPATVSTPIIRIAYDLGYQSLAPFNAAFKAATGLTPTAFRKEG